jgi:hypothetical protein
MRELARLLLELKKIDTNVKQFSDVFVPHKFELIIAAVNAVAGFCEDNGTYAIPSLVKKLGHSVKHCANLLKGEIIKKKGTAQQRTQIEDFTYLFDSEWSLKLSRHANNDLYVGKWNKPTMLPLAEDVKKLNSYLNSEQKRNLEILRTGFSHPAWDQLGKITLAHLIRFKRRRVGEVQRLLLETVTEKRQLDKNSDIYDSLSDVEKTIAQGFYHVEIRGKRGRKVPLLMTENCVQVMEILSKYRKDAGVVENNPFVFARGYSHLRGSDVLRFVAKECKASKPENLTSTRLRKQVATVSQLLNLRDNELDQLANFMGHDARIHREYYRLPDNAIHLAKISKLLLAVDDGRASFITCL